LWANKEYRRGIMNHKEDNKITESLLDGTNEAEELKTMVWNNIKNELNLSEGESKNMKTKKNGIPAFVKYGSIAAAMAIVIASNTQYGHAAADKIKQLFAPNKIVKLQIEGTNEKQNVSLKEGSAKYIIYIDEERYTMVSKDGKDKITPKIKAKNYPEVFMEIHQIKGKTPKALASEIEKELKTKYKNVDNKGAVKEPLKAIFLNARSGSKSKDTVVNYYLVDNTKGGTFVIKQQYFVEASEGHGARFYGMLKEFKIVNE
jgi:hypothetical protein